MLNTMTRCMCRDVWVNCGIIHFLFTATNSNLVHRPFWSLSQQLPGGRQENPPDRSPVSRRTRTPLAHTLTPSGKSEFPINPIVHVLLWPGSIKQLYTFIIRWLKMDTRRSFGPTSTFLWWSFGAVSWHQQHYLQLCCCCHPGALAWNATSSSGNHISLSPNRGVISGTWMHKQPRHECTAGQKEM